MFGPQMCEKNPTKSESERGKCQKRVLRGGRKINRTIMSSASSSGPSPLKRVNEEEMELQVTGVITLQLGSPSNTDVCHPNHSAARAYIHSEAYLP